MIAISFWFFLFVASLTVFLTGRTTERRFLTLLLVGVIGTFMLNANLGWVAAHPFVFLVDTGFLIASLALTSRTATHWPIWFSAFLSIAVATGLAQILFPSQIPTAYIAVQGFWFLPAMGSMAVGTVLDWRSRKQEE